MGSKAVFRQYVASFSAEMSSAMTGVCFVWFTPILLTLQNSQRSEILLTSDELGWLVASIEIGELFGPVPAEFVADRWGRKPSLMLSFPLTLVSWIITAATRSQVGLYAARLLQGIATGIVYTICPMYVAEIAQPSIRGVLCGHMQSFWYLGVLYSYAIGPYVSYTAYVYLSAIPVVLFFVSFIFIPESPYFYLMKGDRKKAETALSWFRGDCDVTKELESIEDSVKSDTEGTSGGWNDLFFSQRCRKPLLLMSFLVIVKYLAGVTTITNYATQTFSRGNGELDVDLATIIMGVILLSTSIFSAYIVDSVGRRPLILTSTLLLGLSSTVITVFFYLEQAKILEGAKYEWLLYAGVASFCVSSNVGLGSVQTTLQAEYFPSHVRAPAGAFTTILSNFFVFISIKLYQLLEDYEGPYANYLLFTVVSFIALFVLCPFMEETAKKSLGEIQSKRK